jgi:hypothetical protein
MQSSSGGSKEILKGLYQWLFIECKIIGMQLNPRKWILYPVCYSTPRQRNAYNYVVYTIFFVFSLYSPDSGSTRIALTLVRLLGPIVNS